MKFCENCSTEIDTRDGENLCRACEDAEGDKRKLKNRRAKMRRREREAILRSCGLVKVRGAMGGTYWE
jgi:hypothetical protein